jgi:hypothetical protein
MSTPEPFDARPRPDSPHPPTRSRRFVAGRAEHLHALGFVALPSLYFAMRFSRRLAVA